MKFIYLIIYDKWIEYFYTNNNKGSRLKIVENIGDGLTLVKGKGCNMKSKSQIGKG